MFVGVKMIAEPWLHISVGVSLVVILGILAVAVVVSWIVRKNASN
jgi:hypothetical protein